MTKCRCWKWNFIHTIYLNPIIIKLCNLRPRLKGIYSDSHDSSPLYLSCLSTRPAAADFLIIKGYEVELNRHIVKQNSWLSNDWILGHFLQLKGG